MNNYWVQEKKITKLIKLNYFKMKKNKTQQTKIYRLK